MVDVIQTRVYVDYLRLMAGMDFEKNRVVVLCGLPGSGKSTLGELLRDHLNYAYLSSDVARKEVMKLTKGKYATTAQYERFKERVYAYIRGKAVGWVKQGRKVVLDATHLNEQRKIVLDIFRKEGLWNNELMLIYVDGGKKERIKRRLARKEGKNADGRSWVEAWETAYDYFTERIKAGKIRVPRIEEEGYPVVWVKNY